MIPLTFRKYFYQVTDQDVSRLAVENLPKLTSLINNVNADIQVNSFLFLEQQIIATICQTNNYSQAGLVIKKATAFQKIEQVCQ